MAVGPGGREERVLKSFVRPELKSFGTRSRAEGSVRGRKAMVASRQFDNQGKDGKDADSLEGSGETITEDGTMNGG
jgi:hypothetical protein